MKRPGTKKRIVLLVGGLLSIVFVYGYEAVEEPASEPDNPHGDLKESCEMCHSPAAWRPATLGPEFDHAKFGYPLRAAHATANCMACHESLVFSAVGQECVSCHQDVHRGELGTDCARCHTERSFIEQVRMRRAHQLTRFPLRGGHATLDCEDCHAPVAQGRLVYVNLRPDCQSCHLDDYAATSGPDHMSVGFPTECELCHNVIVWDKARLRSDVIGHDANFFPIFSGSHARTWVTCDECHVSNMDYGDFSCIFCHAHADSIETTAEHAGITGFRYESRSCFSCHPQGEKN